MKYEQRDVVEVNFMFPDGSLKPHPALIISNNELQENEGYIYLCMISSKDYNPQYSFTLSNEMLTKPLSKQSYVKCQLIMGDIERDVVRKISRIKQPYFDQIVEKIKDQPADPHRVHGRGSVHRFLHRPGAGYRRFDEPLRFPYHPRRHRPVLSHPNKE